MTPENATPSQFDRNGREPEAVRENLALRQATIAEIRKIESHRDFLRNIGPNNLDLLDTRVTSAQVSEVLSQPEVRTSVAEQLHYFLIERIEAAYDLLAENEDGAYYIDANGKKAYRTKGSLFGSGVTKAEDVILLRNIQVGSGRNVSFEKIRDFLPPQVQEIFDQQSGTYFTVMTETQRARKLQEVTDKKAGGKVGEQEGFQWISSIENFKPKSLSELVSGRPLRERKTELTAEVLPSTAYGILLREVISMYYHALNGAAYSYRSPSGVEVKNLTFGFLPTDKEYGSDPMRDLYLQIEETIESILAANAQAEWAQPLYKGDAKKREIYLKSIIETAYSVMWSWGEVMRLDPNSKKFALGGLVSANRYFPREKDGGTSKSSNGTGTSKDFNPAVGDNPSLVELPTALIHKKVLLPLDEITVGATGDDIKTFFDSFGPKKFPDTRFKNSRFMDAFAKISQYDYFDDQDDAPDYNKLAQRFIVVVIKESEAGSRGLPFLVERTPQIDSVLGEFVSAVRSGDQTRINIAQRKHLPVTMNLRDALFVNKVPLIDRATGVSLINTEEGLQESNLQAQLALYYKQVEDFFIKSSKTDQKTGPFDFSEETDWTVDPHFRVRWSTRLGFNLFSRIESYLGSGRVARTVLNPLILSRKEQFADLFFEIYPKQDMDPLVGIVNRGGIRAELDRSGVQKIVDSILNYYFRTVAQMQDFHLLDPVYDQDGSLSGIAHRSPQYGGKDAEVFPEAFSKMFREPEHWRDQPVFANERVSVAYKQQNQSIEVLANSGASADEKRKARIDLAKAVFSLKIDLVLRPLINLYFGKLMYEYSAEERKDLFPDLGTGGEDPELENEYLLRWLMTDNPFPSVTGGKEKAPLPHKLVQMVKYFTELYTDFARQFYDEVKLIDPQYVENLSRSTVNTPPSQSLVRSLLGRFLPPKDEPKLTRSQEDRMRLHALLSELLPGLQARENDPNTHQLTIGNFRYLLWNRLSELGVISGPRWYVFAMEILQLAGMGKYNKRIDGEKEYLNLQQLKNEGIQLIGNPEK
jgi:hypothetical protein